MAQILFFALKEDLLEIFDEVEPGHNLVYAKAGRFLEPGLSIIETGGQIPGLGTATSDSAITSDKFLAANSADSLRLRIVNEHNGITSFHLDQLMNPDTIEILPAGLWGEDVVLQGRVATCSQSKESVQLFNGFQSAINARFSKISASYVGSGAMTLLHSGKRFTIAVQSSRDLDSKA